MADEFNAPTESGSAPLGAEAASGPGNNSVAQTPVAEPNIYDVDDSSLIRVKGSKDPVKFSDYGKQFQAQATRAQQERARVEKELAQERELRQRYENERQTQQRQPAGQQPDVFADLRALPYLSGEDAVKVVQSISSQIQQRDQITIGLARELQKLQQTVGSLNQTHTQSTFSSKIDRFLSEGGYGPELKDLAIETYLAYEPTSDLDGEFPRILAERIDQVQKYVAAQQQKKLNEHRRQPFVPGRGGNGSPQKPITLDPRADARQVADQLWDSIQVGNNT